ncbi:hypothetical protein D3C71_1701640 [compost metagenome]
MGKPDFARPQQRSTASGSQPQAASGAHGQPDEPRCHNGQRLFTLENFRFPGGQEKQMGAVRFQPELGDAQRRGEGARRDLHAIAGNLAMQRHSGLQKYNNALH